MRWACARALQRKAFSTLFPHVTRTPLLSGLYRLLGAEVGRGTLLDTAGIADPQLVSIGPGSRLHHGVSVAGAMLTPAKAVSAADPVLLMSPVGVAGWVGKGCLWSWGGDGVGKMVRCVLCQGWGDCHARRGCSSVCSFCVWEDLGRARLLKLPSRQALRLNGN